MNTGGGILTPSMEIGVRHDGGDAETGFGADIGAGLSWADPGSGLSADIRARALLAHEADGFSERGFSGSGSVSWDPEPSTALGPSLTLTQKISGFSRNRRMSRSMTISGRSSSSDGHGVGMDETAVRAAETSRAVWRRVM